MKSLIVIGHPEENFDQSVCGVRGSSMLNHNVDEHDKLLPDCSLLIFWVVRPADSENCLSMMR